MAALTGCRSYSSHETHAKLKYAKLRGNPLHPWQKLDMKSGFDKQCRPAGALRHMPSLVIFIFRSYGAKFHLINKYFYQDVDLRIKLCKGLRRYPAVKKSAWFLTKTSGLPARMNLSKKLSL